MPFALQIAGLTREFRGRGKPTALDLVTLDVPQASLVTVIGPSGAGKSTLLRILAHDDHPTAGAISHPGIEPRHIGSLLQTDVLSPRHSLAENVGAPLRRLRPAVGRREAARLTANALDLVELTALAGELPQNTDAATRQRALLARALVAEPKLLLLDEPFSHQDENGRSALSGTLRHVHDLLGATTVLATRSAATALPLADMVAVLHDGRVVDSGPPRRLYDMPGNALAARLLGPANLLPGVVVATTGDIAAIRLSCGPVVEARMPDMLPAGSRCTVCVRPERIAIAGASAADMGDNALDATLIAARFAGATTRLHVLIGNGVELIIDRPSAAGLRGLPVGQTAAIAWQPHHAWAFGA